MVDIACVAIVDVVATGVELVLGRLRDIDTLWIEGTFEETLAVLQHSSSAIVDTDVRLLFLSFDDDGQVTSLTTRLLTLLTVVGRFSSHTITVVIHSSGVYHIDYRRIEETMRGAATLSQLELLVVHVWHSWCFISQDVCWIRPRHAMYKLVEGELARVKLLELSRSDPEAHYTGFRA